VISRNVEVRAKRRLVRGESLLASGCYEHCQKQLVLLIIISLLVGNVSSLLKLVYRETDNPESGEIARSFPLRKKSIRGTDSGRGTRLLCKKIKIEVSDQDAEALEFMQDKSRGLYNWWVMKLGNGERWLLRDPRHTGSRLPAMYLVNAEESLCLNT